MKWMLKKEINKVKKPKGTREPGRDRHGNSDTGAKKAWNSRADMYRANRLTGLNRLKHLNDGHLINLHKNNSSLRLKGNDQSAEFVAN